RLDWIVWRDDAGRRGAAIERADLIAETDPAIRQRATREQRKRALRRRDLIDQRVERSRLLRILAGRGRFQQRGLIGQIPDRLALDGDDPMLGLVAQALAAAEAIGLAPSQDHRK